jgi:hypothetical protein
MAVDPKQPAPGPANIDRQAEGQAVTLLEVSRRVGVWEITRDGQFHGRYHGDQSAFDAAEAAALDVVANGGAADLLWNDTGSQSEASEQATNVALTNVLRIIEFRAGSTRIVR